MKKLYITLLFTVLSTYYCSAQIQIGIKQGINFSSLNYTLSDESDQLYERFDINGSAGFHIGAFFNFKFSEKLGFQTEMMFSQQGARLSIVEIIGNDLIEYELRRKLNYLTIPTLLKYQSKSGFNFEGGLGFAFLLSGRDSYDTKTDLAQLFFGGSDPDGVLGINDQDATQFHNSVDVLFILGVGYELPSGLSFGMRYMAGVVNSLDITNDEYVEGEELSNTVFQISIGFPLYGN